MAIHILVFPFPAQGHMLPLLDLAHQLATHPNVRLTILTTPKNLPSLSHLLSLHPSSIQTLTLPLPPHPSLPPGVENVRDVGNSGNTPLISSLHRLQGPILQWCRSHPNPPAAILSDFFLGWTSHLANQLNIPMIAFSTAGAFLAGVIHHCWENLETVQSLDDVVPFPHLPGSPEFKKEQLPSIFRRYKKSDPDSELVRVSMMASVSSSWGIIFNSHDALEGNYIQHLQQISGSGRVYAVGPLVLTRDTNRPKDGAIITDWLDGCPDGSVLYVCFGSQKFIDSPEQLKSIASALEKSGVRFIWVVKSSVDEKGWGLVVEGLEKRVGGRGKVMRGWVEQVEILNHRAVGYFLSHCGWNSVLEATVAGVVVLAWPMEADQYVNARLLVKDMGVAVQVCEGGNVVPDPNELARVIAELMSDAEEEEESGEKARAKVLREKARSGSNIRSAACEVDTFVDDLCNFVRSAKHQHHHAESNPIQFVTPILHNRSPTWFGRVESHVDL